MSFSQHLFALPTERLREIVRNRASTLRAVPRIRSRRDLCAFLAQALSERSSVLEALHNTNLLQVRVLVFAIVQGGSPRFEKLVQAAGTEARDRLNEAIDQLEAFGLLLWIRNEEGEKLFIPNAVRQHTPLPAPLQHQLPDALYQYDAATVLQIHENLGLPPAQSHSKTSRSAAIIEELRDPVRLRAQIERLSPEARRILDYVIKQQGVTSLYELGARLDSRHRNQLYSYDWSRRWVQGKPRNAAEELLGLGLLALQGTVGWGYGVIVIPGDVLSTLTGRSLFSGGAPKLPEWQAVPAERLSPRRHESLTRDVAYLLGLLGRSEAARTNKGLIHKNTLKTVAKGLTIPTVDYAAFVYALCREADLIAPQGRHAHYDVTRQGLAWLEESADVQASSLYKVWRSQCLYSENAAEPLQDSRAYYNLDEIRTYRNAAITLLKELDRERPGELASLGSMAARARFRWWSRFAGGAGVEASEEVGADPALSSEEEECEAESARQNLSALNILKRLCAESLAWLGMVEFASPAGKGLDASIHVRLYPLGRRLLADEAALPIGSGEVKRDEPVEIAGQRVDRFVVQPNLEIYAPPNLNPSLLYHLFRVADPNASGMMTLSKETLRRAFDHGENAEGLLQFLASHSSTGVPQNVEYLIREVGGRHGHIKVGQAGIYLQVSDPVLLQELMAQKRLGIHFRGTLSDTIALVTGDSVESILKMLRTGGYLPVAANGTDRESAHAQKVRFTYSPPKPPRAKPNEAEKNIDWAAIEKEKPEPWKPVEPPVGEEPAATTLPAVEALLKRAIREHHCVEIRYEPKSGTGPTERVIEPVELTGSLVHAWCRLREDARMFNIRYITSARVTGEVFVPRFE